MPHRGDGIAKLRAVNWAISLGHCGLNSVSYNTTALICKRLEQDRRVAGNCNGKQCVNCLSLTLTRSVRWEWSMGKVQVCRLQTQPKLQMFKGEVLDQLSVRPYHRQERQYWTILQKPRLCSFLFVYVQCQCVVNSHFLQYLHIAATLHSKKQMLPLNNN